MGGRGVLQALLHIAVTIFFGIQLRRLGREKLKANFRMRCQKGVGRFTFMNRSPIPDQYKALREEAQNMLQRLHNLLTGHTAGKVSFINFAAQRQANRSQNTAPLIFDAPQNRLSAARRPGRRQAFTKGKPKFIKNHDFDAVALRFFYACPIVGEKCPNQIFVTLHCARCAWARSCSPCDFSSRICASIPRWALASTNVRTTNPTRNRNCPKNSTSNGARAVTTPVRSRINCAVNAAMHRSANCNAARSRQSQRKAKQNHHAILHYKRFPAR